MLLLLLEDAVNSTFSFNAELLIFAAILSVVGFLVSTLLTLLIVSIRGLRRDFKDYTEKADQAIAKAMDKAVSAKQRVVNLETALAFKRCLDIDNFPCDPDSKDSSPPLVPHNVKFHPQRETT